MAEPFKPVDVKKATPEEIAAGLALLNKRKEYEHKVKTGQVKGARKYSEMTEAEKAKAKLYSKRALIRDKLLKAKAAKAGIAVTSAEIDAELKKSL
jgi:hypothetical protein